MYDYKKYYLHNWVYQLEGANLSGANLGYALLYDVDLSGANLSLADLRHAVLSRVNLNDANLVNVYL